MTTLGATSSTTTIGTAAAAASTDFATAGYGGRYKAGWYLSSNHCSVASSAAPALNELIATWVVVPKACSVDRIGCNVVTVAASSVVRLGIYTPDVNGFPSALVLDAGTVDTASGTGDKEITINQALTAGVYWLAGVSQGGTPTMSCWTTGNKGIGPGTTAQSNTSYPGMLMQSISGALPTPFVATWERAPMRLWLRYA